MNIPSPIRRLVTPWVWCLLAAAAASIGLRAEDKPLSQPDLAIGLDVSEVRTGHVHTNRRGLEEPLVVPVIVTIQNRTGTAIQTSAEITGKDHDHAAAELVKTEQTANGQELHLTVRGLRPTFEESEIFLTITLRQGDEVKATKSIPIRVSVPMLLKLQGETLFEGPANPGLVNRALNMRSAPKASVSHPEARFAAMCLHDVRFTVLDQYGDPLPPIFKGAPVWAALGKSDYEATNRILREDATFLDSIGFWQFVGGVSDMTVDPGRAELHKFLSSPPPPCTDQQYTTYEPLLVQYQIGGYPIGTYRRQVTLKDSGDDHRPIMKIDFIPVLDPPLETPAPQ